MPLNTLTHTYSCSSGLFQLSRRRHVLTRIFIDAEQMYDLNTMSSAYTYCLTYILFLVVLDKFYECYKKYFHHFSQAYYDLYICIQLEFINIT